MIEAIDRSSALGGARVAVDELDPLELALQPAARAADLGRR